MIVAPDHSMHCINTLFYLVVHRRGGRPSGVGRRKQRTPARRRSQSTSDENSSDGGSITRCICGETRKFY